MPVAFDIAEEAPATELEIELESAAVSASERQGYWCTGLLRSELVDESVGSEFVR